MLHAIRTAYPELVVDLNPPANTSAPTSPTDAMSPVPSLSRSILSASDTSPNGWVTLELPQTTSPAHSPTPSNNKSDDGCSTHVRFHDTCLIIPDTPIKSPGLAARMLGVGAWSTKRRVSDPDREQSPTGALLGVRLPGLGRKPKHTPCEALPCAPAVLKPCLAHRSNSQHAPILSSSAPMATPRPRLSAVQSTPHAPAFSSLPSVLVRAPTRANSLPPSTFSTTPLRECCPDCVRACTQLEGAVRWSAGAKQKRREDRAEREREAKAGLRDTSTNSAFGWEDMLVLEASDADDNASESEAGPSSSSAYQRRNTSPPPSSLATRRCGVIAAKALKHPHALPCPLPRVCTEDDTDEEGLFPLPISPRGIRSPCSRSPGKKSPKCTSSTNTPSPSAGDEVKCAGTKDRVKCAEVIAAQCAEKAKVEVVVPAVRRLLEVQQASFEGHRLSPVPGSEENTPRSGTPTLKEEERLLKEERGRKFDMALVDELTVAPPVSGSANGSEIRPGAGRRRSSSASSVGRTLGALVRGVAAGVAGGQPM